MVARGTPPWTFLTRHAQALVCIANDPGIRLRDIGDRVAITERAAHRIVTELAAAGYITRTRTGRRNNYTINETAPLPDPVARQQNVGELLTLLTHTPLHHDTTHSEPTPATAQRPHQRRCSPAAPRASSTPADVSQPTRATATTTPTR
jgi:hypothetical protein